MTKEEFKQLAEEKFSSKGTVIWKQVPTNEEFVIIQSENGTEYEPRVSICLDTNIIRFHEGIAGFNCVPLSNDDEIKLSLANFEEDIIKAHQEFPHSIHLSFVHKPEVAPEQFVNDILSLINEKYSELMQITSTFCY